MTSKETMDARIEVAQAFSKIFLNPLFHRDFLLLTETDLLKEYNTAIIAGSEEKIHHILDRFIKTGDTQASIVSLVDGEVMIRVVSLTEGCPESECFDIYSDTSVYSWLQDENLFPEGTYVVNGRKFLAGGNIYRKNIEKLCGFTDN